MPNSIWKETPFETTVVLLDAGQVMGVLEVVAEVEVDAVAIVLVADPDVELSAKEVPLDVVAEVVAIPEVVAELLMDSELDVLLATLLVLELIVEDEEVDARSLAPQTPPFESAAPRLDLR